MSLAMWAEASISYAQGPWQCGMEPGGLGASHFSTVPNESKNSNFKRGLPGCYEKYIICKGGSIKHVLLSVKI